MKDVPSYSRLNNYVLAQNQQPDTNRLKLHTHKISTHTCTHTLILFQLKRCAILAESCCERCAILQQARQYYLYAHSESLTNRLKFRTHTSYYPHITLINLYALSATYLNDTLQHNNYYYTHIILFYCPV